jgi:hypothetical protein
LRVHPALEQRARDHEPVAAVVAASIAATAWRPAFSISTIEGSPMSWIVRRSASRICSVLSTRMPDVERTS